MDGGDGGGASGVGEDGGGASGEGEMRGDGGDGGGKKLTGAEHLRNESTSRRMRNTTSIFGIFRAM